MLIARAAAVDTAGTPGSSRHAALLSAVAGMVAVIAAAGAFASAEVRAAEVATPPAGRGYELVTPANTNGLFPFLPPFFTASLQVARNLATPDGERVLFVTEGPVTAAATTRTPAPYLAKRGDQGWTHEYVGAPGDLVDIGQLGTVPSGLSPVLSLVPGGTTPLGGVLDPADVDQRTDYYLRRDDGTFILATPTPFSDDAVSLHNMARNGGTWTYSATDFATFEFSPVFAWTADGPEPVSVLDEGTLTLDKVNLTYGVPLSADGSRVAFVARTFDGAGPWRIWIRLRDEARTVLASAPEGALSDTDLDANMDVLTQDGSALLFTTAQALMSSDLDTQVDLYRFNIDTESLELVSAAAIGAPSNGQANACSPTYGVSGCSVSPGGYSADGTTVYFISPEALDIDAVTGAPNLYVNSNGDTRLVAVLAPGDMKTGEAGWRNGFLSNRPLRVNGDGSRVVFESAAQLTEYANGGVKEIYVYDAEAKALSCASCSNATPALGGNAMAELRTQLPLKVTAGSYSTQGRNIANDGATVYFQTAERLVASDINGVIDVYEYDLSTDSMTLMSSGVGSTGSAYVDNSEDGEDVFFFSMDNLVPEEQDQNGNIWKIFDARRGGGFSEAPRSAPCGDADCRGPLAAPPAFSDLTDGDDQNVASRRIRLGLSVIDKRAGRIVLSVRRSAPGRVRLVAKARIAGRLRSVSSRSTNVGRGGGARVVLRLSRRAREALERRSLSVSLRGSSSGARTVEKQVRIGRTGR
jgi:hypothetical protein